MTGMYSNLGKPKLDEKLPNQYIFKELAFVFDGAKIHLLLISAIPFSKKNHVRKKLK
jgi:hypothetical protein